VLLDGGDNYPSKNDREGKGEEWRTEPSKDEREPGETVH